MSPVKAALEARGSENQVLRHRPADEARGEDGRRGAGRVQAIDLAFARRRAPPRERGGLVRDRRNRSIRGGA